MSLITLVYSLEVAINVSCSTKSQIYFPPKNQEQPSAKSFIHLSSCGMHHILAQCHPPPSFGWGGKSSRVKLVYPKPGSQEVKTLLAGQAMYRAMGYTTARGRFKTSWDPAKKVSEQYLQPNGCGNAFCSGWYRLSDNI